MFRWRWQLEVTFEEVRTHLGVESQRQWSPMAILRTTPALLALFSIVVLLAHQAQSLYPFQLPHTAWYHKPLPTFSGAVALDLLAQRQVALATLKQGGVLILDAPANQITEQLVDRYLQLKARSQL